MSSQELASRYEWTEASNADLTIPTEKSTTTKNDASKQPHDGVHGYAKDTLTLRLLLMEFTDAVREGDGERILKCWKFLLPLFKSSGHTNYSIDYTILLPFLTSDGSTAGMEQNSQHTRTYWQEYLKVSHVISI